MFLSELRQVLVRRWYLIVVGLAATIGLAFAVTGMVSPSYTATSETLMLPPSTSVPNGSNPYLALGGLDAAGDVLSKAVSSEVTAAEIKAKGGEGEYTLVLDPDTPAPLVLLTVQASDAADAMFTMNLVLERLPAALEDIQEAANVPKQAYISSTLVVKSEVPVKSSTPQLRALVVAIAGGIGVSLLLIAALDAILRRPQNRGVHRGNAGVDVNMSRSQRRSAQQGSRRRSGVDGDEVRSLTPIPSEPPPEAMPSKRGQPVGESLGDVPTPSNGDGRLHPAAR